MKVIDLFKKIANGEEVPEHIRIGDSSYYYDCSDSDYYNDIENAPSLLERIWRHNAYAWLNLEVEILPNKEDEFIDIEEITLKGEKISFGSMVSWLIDTTKNEEKIGSAIDSLGITINDLIKNQKKIINKLKEEGK